jgi:hypothetical protein
MNRCILREVEVLPILSWTIGLRVRKILVIVVYAHKIKILDQPVGENKGICYLLVSHSNVVYETSVPWNTFVQMTQRVWSFTIWFTKFSRHGCKRYRCFWDLLLVVQQIKGEFQCFDELLSSYLDRCLVIVKSLDTFTMKHISREEIPRANFLAWEASGYLFSIGKFFILEKPMLAAVASYQFSAWCSLLLVRSSRK